MTDLRKLDSFADIHTHGPAGENVVKSVEPAEGLQGEVGQAWYSVGIHPWSTSEEINESTIASLEEMASDPRVVAIGEAGLDKNRGGSQAYQEKIFRLHAALAEKVEKPLVIHCVGRYGRIMELRRELSPSVRWIIHGFTGKPELVRQLLAAGFDISLGRRANPDVEAVVPPSRLFHETD